MQRHTVTMAAPQGQTTVGWNKRLFCDGLLSLGKPLIYDGEGNDENLEEFKVEDCYGMPSPAE